MSQQHYSFTTDALFTEHYTKGFSLFLFFLIYKKDKNTFPITLLINISCWKGSPSKTSQSGDLLIIVVGERERERIKELSERKGNTTVKKIWHSDPFPMD